MESYSLIDLLEKEDEDEELEDDDFEVRRKRRLADSILNFISHKDFETQQEEDILASLFEIPTSDQTKEVELLTDKVEPEVVARVVVETRINDLTKEMDYLEDKEDRVEQVEKIKALQEIRSYLVAESPEINTVKSEEVEIEEFVVIDEVKESKTTQIASEHIKPTQPNMRAIRREQTLKKPNYFEFKPNSLLRKNFRHDYISRPKLHEHKPSMPTKSLAATRELINKIYEKPKLAPIPHESLKHSVMPIIPKEQYHNLVNKNIPDIESIRKLLQKNNFDLVAQQKIISEILAGGDPGMAIERQLKSNEKNLGQTSAYAHRPNEYTPVTTLRRADDEVPITKASLVKQTNKPITSNPRLWAIIIVLIILIGIIFRVI